MKVKSFKEKTKSSKETEAEIMRVHNLFWESYAKRDIELRFSLCSEEVTFIGSGLHERAINKNEYKKINQEGIKQFPDPFQINFLWTNLTMLNENVACVESEVLWSQLINEEMSKELLRNTTLLKYDNNKWLVTHVHGSVPDYRLKVGDYMTNEQTIIRNKELERQVYERTQDLNNTLEELEQKNRELEIEASLEKVRSIAMGMRIPSDMLAVCKTISIQLQFLGVKEIRNVQTAIFYEHRGTYMNYEFYAKHDKTFITETVFTNNAIHNEFAAKMLKGKGEIFITHIKGIEVKDWIAYQKTTNVFIDEYLETASSLNYYWFSLGPVALGISTYHPLQEEEINLFKRFLKVFELAYQRYMDIEKAETQAREAQIEAALEKVRAAAMSMNKPDDLLSVCQVLFAEFCKLGFDEMRNAMINIHDDEKGTFLNYDYSDEIGKSVTLMNYNSHPVMEKQIKQSRITNDAFSEAVYGGEDLKAWKEFRKKYGEKDDPRIKNINALYYYFYSIGNGTIGISTFSPIGEEKLILLKRFRNVFSLSYQRYSDIAQAEAQAREAQIEAALERVRSKAMAMHTSNDLSETMGVLFTQLPKLGISSLRCGVVLLSKNSSQGVFYAAATTSESDSFTMIGSGDMMAHPVFENQYNYWLKNENYFTTLSGEDLRSYYKSLFARVSQPYNPRGHKEQTEHGYYFSFSEGMFYAWDEKPYSEDEINILNRFKTILDLTFRRYLDLKKAEAQARESTIEAALERVRAKAMSMHTPDELSETVSLFFKELKSLNVLPWRCGVGRIDEDTRTTYLTTTSITKDGKIAEVAGKLRQTGHPVLDGIFEHWKQQEEYYPVLRGDEINKYYSIIKPQIAYPDYPLDAVQYGHNFPFKEGFIFAWTENRLSEDELQIFRRFSSVLSLTYRRYLDLKEAEERNKIIQAENDRKTKELEEARQLQLSLLPRTLPQLPQFDIAVYMKTATEVGGDYYDFNIQENGVLNIGIGDATGHGLQAGTMITLMKGFFTSDAARFSPHKFLEHCNGMIRDIKLGRILMSFSHLRFENNSLLISSAGMPPVYYHHKKNNRTEEIIIQGLPLGAMRSASYRLVEKELNSGDTILLLTDGLPEQMNNQREIFDYSRVLKYFDEIAENAPNEIINRFVQKADEWIDRQKQNDDITFIVIKIL